MILAPRDASMAQLKGLGDRRRPGNHVWFALEFREHEGRLMASRVVTRDPFEPWWSFARSGQLRTFEDEGEADGEGDPKGTSRLRRSLATLFAAAALASYLSAQRASALDPALGPERSVSK